MINEIIKNVCLTFQVSESELFSNRRTVKIADARRACYYLIYLKCSLTLEKTAEVLYRGDHTTVMHGIRRHKEIYEIDIEYRKKVNKIIKNLEV